MSDKITELEAELDEWTSGNKSHWNECHGSVTGDHAGQYKATAEADAAEIRVILAKLEGARAALPNPLDEIAKQLRIANLIAFMEAEGGPYKDINDIQGGRSSAIEQIREGLGL